jgi:hypothetical protein
MVEENTQKSYFCFAMSHMQSNLTSDCNELAKNAVLFLGEKSMRVRTSASEENKKSIEKKEFYGVRCCFYFSQIVSLFIVDSFIWHIGTILPSLNKYCRHILTRFASNMSKPKSVHANEGYQPAHQVADHLYQ